MNTASDQTSPRSPECNITRIHTTTPLARRACSRWCAQHALCLSDIAPPQGVSSPSSCAWKRQQHGSNRHELAVVVTPPHPPLPSPINGPHNVPDDTGRRVCLHKLRLDVGLGDLDRTAAPRTNSFTACAQDELATSTPVRRGHAGEQHTAISTAFGGSWPTLYPALTRPARNSFMDGDRTWMTELSEDTE